MFGRRRAARAHNVETVIVVEGEKMTMIADFVVTLEGVANIGDVGDKENLARPAFPNALGWTEAQKRLDHAGLSCTATVRHHRVGPKGRRVM
jgi:hypothetical protein